MIKYLFFIILLWGICLYAQDNKTSSEKVFESKDIVENRDISDRFQLGEFLVYDCVNNNWICTRKAEFERCKTERKEASKGFKKNLVCAYFNDYKTTLECQKVQQQMVNRGLVDNFCHNKDKSIL